MPRFLWLPLATLPRLLDLVILKVVRPYIVSIVRPYIVPLAQFIGEIFRPDYHPSSPVIDILLGPSYRADWLADHFFLYAPSLVSDVVKKSTIQSNHTNLVVTLDEDFIRLSLTLLAFVMMIFLSTPSTLLMERTH